MKGGGSDKKQHAACTGSFDAARKVEQARWTLNTNKNLTLGKRISRPRELACIE